MASEVRYLPVPGATAGLQAGWYHSSSATNHIRDANPPRKFCFFISPGHLDCKLGQRPNCNQTAPRRGLFICAYRDFYISVISIVFHKIPWFGMMSLASCVDCIYNLRFLVRVGACCEKDPRYAQYSVRACHFSPNRSALAAKSGACVPLGPLPMWSVREVAANLPCTQG